MAPVWAEIMDKINPIIQGRAKGTDANRFHLISGHDDTVAPLMASLGLWNETSWPPYASMFLIEVSIYLQQVVLLGAGKNIL